jgi:hypothetical protein
MSTAVSKILTARNLSLSEAEHAKTVFLSVPALPVTATKAALLPGCGQALALAGIGDNLLPASREVNLVRHIKEWRVATSEGLLHHSYKISRSAERVLSSKINVFPSIDVLNLYVNPTTTLSTQGVLPSTRTWSTVQQPNVPALMEFTRNHLGWLNPDDSKKMLESNVWEGALMRLLYSVSC